MSLEHFKDSRKPMIWYKSKGLLFWQPWEVMHDDTPVLGGAAAAQGHLPPAHRPRLHHGTADFSDTAARTVRMRLLRTASWLCDSVSSNGQLPRLAHK